MRASTEQLIAKIDELENRLAESEQLIEAIQAGEVDAFAISLNDQSEIYTLQSGDYAYRVLIEEFGEGALNVTEDGLIVYTNPYLCDLLQLPYEKVIGSSIFNFLSEDSKEKFNELIEHALTGKSKGEINLAVNNKTIPVYISLTSLQPKLATVGIIITDLSEKKKNEEVILKYQRDLEAKNHELIQSNADLASFAFIASHDLQEPLRKIQTFSNRLLDSNYENFSDRTKDYFERIIAASKQMQNLINALLDYSRVNTSKVIYTPTDLNELVKVVKENLHELIHESNAVIEASQLPVLSAIPHQFTQLFSNIITNAIKYRRLGVNPVIKIFAFVVKINGAQEEDEVIGSKYWKIQVSDNGIGFEQIFEDKIFELFQRLHSRVEYEGTGIGLAICKRIVQNHNGFIRATGKPGLGSSFSIYIPSGGQQDES
jgi:PAS domain S-box-containing protein